jgi:hypothetical protein
MFKNLAGVANCDEHIKYELERCRIPIEQAQGPIQSEVPYTLIGKLNGPYTFTRLWTYWVVEGLVPLSVAKELYADPVGRDDIRVAGHCGCPPPEAWAEWITLDEERVIPVPPDNPKIAGVYTMLNDRMVVFSDFPESFDAKQFVTSYHIDSEVGLRVFADTLRAHDLIAEPEPVAA